MGAPFGNKNASGGRSGGGGIDYNSPKFLKAARRQAKTAGGSAAKSFLKMRSETAFKYAKGKFS